MAKYGFEIDLSENSSTGLILRKIKKGSTVLEFGCANGRMTKYMCEILECQVYIVEIDPSSFEVANRYAKKGICGDILNFAWVEEFKEVQFDAIIFADVLEHLTNPKAALSKAKLLLKKDGCIYVSIPNITHNDILLREMDEHFDYTSIGLLDDTHMHFWGLENIAPFADECGLRLANLEATYCSTGMTEQYKDRHFAVDPLILNRLNERLCGEVYQFVFTLNTFSEETEINIRKSVVKSHIYLDTGAGFNQNEVIEFESEHVGNYEYIAHYVIKNSERIRQIRFDPVEFQGCILKYLTIRQGNKELELIYEDQVQLGNGVLLCSNDPKVLANIDNQIDPIIIEANILLPGRSFLEEVTTKFKNFSEENQNLRGENQNLRGENHNLKEENDSLRGVVDQFGNENEILRGNIVRLQVDIVGMQQNIERLNLENDELKRNLGAYIVLANKKDECLIAFEKSGDLHEEKHLNEKIRRRINKLIKRQE